MENSNKGPEHTFRDGNLKATIWRNEGENGPYFMTKLTRTYKDAQGEYRESSSLGKEELLRGGELLRNSHNFINERQREQTQSQSRNATKDNDRESFREKRQEKAAPQREAPSHDR